LPGFNLLKRKGILIVLSFLKKEKKKKGVQGSGS
jgi:hypothetical protein